MSTTTFPTDFAKRLDQTAEDTETQLAKLLSDDLLPDEIARPKRLMEAIRYSTLGGGKRLRPFLVVESAGGVRRDRARSALLAGAALECVHCYSLIHDDLPAMDDDDLRRGRPTLHKAYDDATAILAGDALLTLAFDIISRDEIQPTPMCALLLTRALARASGIGGMVGGQMLDLAGEGRFGDREPVDVARAAADEDRRAAALSAASPARSSARRRRRNTRRWTITAARSARRSRSPTTCSTSKATPTRSASRPAPMPRSARPPSSPSSASTAPSSGCATCWRAPTRRWRSSAPRATCCAPPPTSSPNARTSARHGGVATPRIRISCAFGSCRAGAGGLCAAAAVRLGRGRDCRGVAAAAGCAAAGDAAADRLGRLDRRVSDRSPSR